MSEPTQVQESLKQAYAMFKKDSAKGTAYEQDASVSEKQFDEFLAKELVNTGAKANETHHSTNTGYGAEFYPVAVQGDINMNMIHRSTSLAQALARGYLGTSMPATYEELILGESDYFIGNAEHTAATGTLPDLPSGTQKPQTDKVSVEQRQFKKEIQISKKLVHYGPSNFVAKVTEALRIGAAKTIDAFILNADSASSGNVNLEGASPATTLYYMQSNGGIRDVAIADTNTHDVGTLASTDVLSVLALLGDYAADIDDLLLIVPMNVYLKMLDLEELITIDKFGPSATITTGVLGKIFGIDVLVTNVMPSLAQSSGKVHTTGGNNTLGQFALVKRSAVLHGSGDEFQVTPTVIPGLGLRLTSTFDYGLGIAYEAAGLGKTAAIGRNVTV